MSTPIYNLAPGRMLGHQYIVTEFLGHGWEGEVYKVEERLTGIVRAVKLFYKHRYTERTPHLNYAKKLYRLKTCPIVIQYLHRGTIVIRRETIDFLVSDFIEGEVLKQFIQEKRGQRIPPFEALHLFNALVQGVEHIHFLGEYHGDIHSENIMVKRSGLGFNIYLIDLMHLGASNRARIQQDVFDLVSVLYEMIGGDKHYRSMPDNIKRIILGRKKSLIARQFKMAGHLRLFLENLDW